MHRIYYPFENGNKPIHLEGEAHHYLSRVIRLGPGQQVILFDESGWEWTAEVVKVDKKSAQLQLLEKKKNPCEPEYPVRLVQGYPKGNKFFDIVRAVTALGVSGIDVFVAKRSVAGRGEQTEKWQGRADKVALEAVRQCGRCRPPEIPSPADSLKEVLDRFNEDKPVSGFCLWEEAEGISLGCAVQEMGEPERGKPILLVIGPEGGLSREEAKAAESAGLVLCHLGPRILRTELAPVVALSVLQENLGQLG
jgi:16S rRNA (uracil1498-N3)-methyltransferase